MVVVQGGGHTNHTMEMDCISPRKHHCTHGDSTKYKGAHERELVCHWGHEAHPAACPPLFYSTRATPPGGWVMGSNQKCTHGTRCKNTRCKSTKVQRYKGTRCRAHTIIIIIIKGHSLPREHASNQRRTRKTRSRGAQQLHTPTGNIISTLSTLQRKRALPLCMFIFIHGIDIIIQNADNNLFPIPGRARVP